MKKILFVTIASSFIGLFSCKSENKVDSTEVLSTVQNDTIIVEENIRESAKGKSISMPNFTDSKAATFAKKYNDYVNELKAAAGENQDKLSELTFKAVELEKEFQQVKEKLSSEENEKLTTFIDELKQSVQ
jgi:hypothetical protein